MYKSGNNRNAAGCSSGIKFKPGTYVWANMDKKFWPAVIISHNDINASSPSKSKSWVFWFGDYRVSEIKDTAIIPFDINFEQIYAKNWNKSPTSWENGVIEAIREFGLPETAQLSAEDLLDWARTLMHQINHTQSGLTRFVLEKLDDIRNKKEDDEDDVGSKAGADYKARKLISDYNNGKTSALHICLGCYGLNAIEQHPIFTGRLCEDCKVRVKDTFYVVKHNIKVYCTICGFSGKNISCSYKNCRLVYCQVCLDDFCGIEIRELIFETDKWRCFTCHKNPNYPRILKVKGNWNERLTEFFGNSDHVNVSQPLEFKRPIRVLSVFDCIATGLVSLTQQNISVEAYFSCEIDTDCKDIVRKNYPGCVKFLGDVAYLTEEDLKRIIPIDLLLVGSPNSDSSFLNPYRSGLNDCDGIGLAFFEFFRVMNLLRLINGRTFFWLFDLNANMNLQRKVSITRMLQCEPKLCDASTTLWKNLILVWNNFPIADNDDEVLEAKKLSQNQNMYNDEIDDEALASNDIDRIETDLGFSKEYTRIRNISNYSRLKILRRASSVKFLNLYFGCFKERFENDNYKYF